MKNFKKLLKLKYIAFSLGAIMVSAIFISAADSDKRNFEIVKNLDVFYTLFRELNSYYVDETNPEELIKTAIDNMLESLDPYTTYIPEDEMEDFNFMTTGEYGGIGSVIRKIDDYVVIDEPYVGSPSQQAGIKAGDKILEVDGESMKGKSTSDVSSKLRGPENTPIEVKVERPGTTKPIELEITRKKISVNAVPYYGMADETTGIIMLTSFTQNCSREIAKALEDLTQNHGAKKIILDLRSNPGGLLDEAVKTVSLFVDKGNNVVSTKGKVQQWDKEYKTTTEPIDTEIPIAILINRGSASASEIVSGSLQDLDRAVLIGQRSFGKGLVQSTRNLSYNATLKVTTAKYYIPSGRCIQAVDYSHRNEDGSVGLVPDSLINEFKTKGGRKVYDGGGVSPDIMIEHPKYHNISFALVTQNMLFNFATDYTLKNKTIPSPSEFTISDELYEQFIQFVEAKEDFTYESATQNALKKLETTAKREKYYEQNKEDFENLSEHLKLNTRDDMLRFKSEIEEFLAGEILKRYYYQKGAIEYSVINDTEVDKAVEVLNDQDTYKGLLDGSVESHAGDKRMANNKKDETEE